MKTKPGHEEEYERYNKLKTDKKKKKSITSDGKQLRQVSLQEMAELRKMWDINDFRAKRIHTKVGEMIAIDYQPVSIVDHEGFKSLISTLEPKYHMSSRKYFTEPVIPSIANRIRTNIATQLKVGAEYLSSLLMHGVPMLTVMHCWDLQHTGLIAVSRGNLLYCRLRNCRKGTQGSILL